MSWEWVGPVATGVVAVAGIAATAITSQQGRMHAERLATEKLNNDRQVSTEERQQARLENAYIKLLEFAEKIGFWAQSSYPLYDTNPAAPPAPLPNLAEQAEVQALVRAFGSADLIQRMDEWAKVTEKLAFAEREILRQKANGGHDISGRREFIELRPQEFELRRRMADAVAADLGHRPQ